jgi:hypothetical protein
LGVGLGPGHRFVRAAVHDFEEDNPALFGAGVIRGSHPPAEAEFVAPDRDLAADLHDPAAARRGDDDGEEEQRERYEDQS